MITITCKFVIGYIIIDWTGDLQQKNYTQGHKMMIWFLQGKWEGALKIDLLEINLKKCSVVVEEKSRTFALTSW